MEKNIKILAGGIIILLLAIAGYFAFFTSDEKIYNEDSTGVIVVKKGDTFKIILKSNPTTGYQWNESFDENLIQLINKTYNADEPQLMGSGGMETFEFKVIGHNSNTTINFAYSRVWESVPPIEEKSFQIKIK
ncbi:MAG: Chagasin family peptidase inhibitor I42 [Candidatus Methanofastidiosum methylothiophilum]|uniref:Chagasin family peptidase inhibitor I42 n=1 Tax=Candidatus Methanofastidiosum methylothiophilum TaxID=1705564 RepID=A0A150IJI4_9EURY|nr:MAG: Chagasin family peptidase inhibitor I42 [Candidatus Methanofastidiosum methylthiophilus]KYC48536.1 MAG: Chagasin family peptidase inhibitor I42 [Candidatus Methanofastidiosum methylthiophilus]KYC51294.1 MAG: Chagasin family peptidase inhibitor I42 [Candidatus Methanofastidiosum methylthiophilus]